MKKLSFLALMAMLLVGAGCTAQSGVEVDNSGLDVDGGIDVNGGVRTDDGTNSY
jgi:hypothetical protein